MSLAIRARLSLWYAAVLSLLLSLFAGVLYLSYSRSRRARFDEELARAGALLRSASPSRWRPSRPSWPPSAAR